MDGSGKMAPLLQSLVSILRCSVVQAMQVQASLVLLIGIIGWTIAGYRKGREAQRLLAAQYAAVLQQMEDAAQQAKLATTAGAVSSHQQSSPIIQSPNSSTDGSAWIELNGWAATAGKGGMSTALQLGPSWLTTADQPQQASILQHWIQQTGQRGDTSAAQRPQQQGPDAASNGLTHRQIAAQQHAQQQDQQSQRLAAEQVDFDPAGVKSASSIFKSHLGSQTAGLHTGWPRLAVVCPVKGCRQHSRDNWATQLAAHYGGPRVFVFVVESELDPAVAALQDMMQQYPRCSRQQDQMDHSKQHCNSAPDPQQQQQQQQHQVIECWQDGPQHQVMLVTAGLTTSCSQKIHNILAGIDVALNQQQQQQQRGAFGSTGGYVCLLDDDVALHPLSLMQMVDELEADQSLFMVTGYPYDIVAAPSSSSSNFWGKLCSYAAATYHLPLCIGFMVVDRGSFVWGGAMLMRAEYLATAAAELATEGQATAAAVGRVHSGELGVSNVSWSAAPCVEGKPVHTAKRQDNILRVWRDGGYSDDLLLSGFCAAHNLSIGLPVAATFPQMLPATCTFKQYWNYLRRQVFVLDTYYSSQNRRTNHTMMILHSYGSALFTAATAATALQLLMLLLMTVTTNLFSSIDGTTTSSSVSARSTVNLHRPLQFNDSLLDFTMGTTTTATWLFAASTIGSWASIWYLNSQIRSLFRVLSPCTGREALECRVSVPMLWLGWMLENLILPLCALHCYLCDHIVWGGITYYKKDGRIVRIVHPSA